jgi:hypothetical protein
MITLMKKATHELKQIDPIKPVPSNQTLASEHEKERGIGRDKPAKLISPIRSIKFGNRLIPKIGCRLTSHKLISVDFSRAR